MSDLSKTNASETVADLPPIVIEATVSGDYMRNKPAKLMGGPISLATLGLAFEQRFELRLFRDSVQGQLLGKQSWNPPQGWISQNGWSYWLALGYLLDGYAPPWAVSGLGKTFRQGPDLWRFKALTKKQREIFPGERGGLQAGAVTYKTGGKILPVIIRDENNSLLLEAVITAPGFDAMLDCGYAIFWDSDTRQNRLLGATRDNNQADNYLRVLAIDIRQDNKAMCLTVRQANGCLTPGALAIFDGFNAYARDASFEPQSLDWGVKPTAIPVRRRCSGPSPFLQDNPRLAPNYGGCDCDACCERSVAIMEDVANRTNAWRKPYNTEP